ncbi:hypothetical protein [Clostridium sp. CMCC3677]|uniref:hypothetical protein n=1 Tax=Clostridium sp. CMCC3677 TaxID=2949963 RepID=UPI0013F05A69|nr:hypothetical protein [Clostridium sp. CMCC3677]NFG62001.1 hypothetical protein [Clostridium botulinum]NFQ08331.1 hypothetical protein [Clostridium botulinum]
MNNRVKLFSIIGILIEILTVFLFFMLTKDRTSIVWLCLIFMILSELILFGGYILIEYIAQKSSQIIIRAGVGTTLFGYWIISFVTSLVFINLEKDFIKYFISLQLIFIILETILIISLITGANKVKQDSDKVLQATGYINTFIDRINLLKNNINNNKYKKLLEKIYDDLRYSDTSTIVPSDSELETKITNLEIALLNSDDVKSDKVTELIEEIFILINKRKAEVKNAKLGGI